MPSPRLRSFPVSRSPRSFLQALSFWILLRRCRSPVGARPAVWLRSVLLCWGGSSRAPTAVDASLVASLTLASRGTTPSATASRASPSPLPLFIALGGSRSLRSRLALTRSRLRRGPLIGHALWQVRTPGIAFRDFCRDGWPALIRGKHSCRVPEDSPKGPQRRSFA